jgi:hypothetical protein
MTATGAIRRLGITTSIVGVSGASHLLCTIYTHLPKFAGHHAMRFACTDRRVLLKDEIVGAPKTAMASVAGPIGCRCDTASASHW